jgi:hypothetical protein
MNATIRDVLSGGATDGHGSAHSITAPRGPTFNGYSERLGAIRQQLIEHLMREIMRYDAEFRREDPAEGANASQARH